MDNILFGSMIILAQMISMNTQSMFSVLHFLHFPVR